jgi:hypothetical protein
MRQVLHEPPVDYIRLEAEAAARLR